MNNPPLATFVVITYNQAHLIGEALAGLRAQDYRPLEVVLTDDCSTDATPDIIRRSIAEDDWGTIDVRLMTGDCNIGIAANFERGLRAAQGEVIVVGGGDDISLSSRVSESVRLLTQDDRRVMLHFAATIIDDDGNEVGRKGPDEEFEITDFDRLFAGKPCGFGATRAFKTIVRDRFPPLGPGAPFEDFPYLMRSLHLGSVLNVPSLQVEYRVGNGSASAADNINIDHMIAEFEQLVTDARLALEGDASFAFFEKFLPYYGSLVLKMRIGAKVAAGRRVDFGEVMRFLAIKQADFREKAGLVRYWLKGAFR